MKRIAYHVGLVVFGFGASACALTSTTAPTTPATLAFEIPETTLIDGPPDVTFAAAEADLVNFHSNWICEFQRRTFTNPEAGDAALFDALDTANIVPETYKLFLDRLDQSQDLRDAVLFHYQESCRG